MRSWSSTLEGSPCSPQLKSSHAVTKTQHSEKLELHTRGEPLLSTTKEQPCSNKDPAQPEIKNKHIK